MKFQDAAKFLNFTLAGELTKLYILGVFICMLGLGYCSFFRSSKQADFIKLAETIQEQCRYGCPAIPSGWQKTNCVDNSDVVDFNKERACAFYQSNSTSLGFHYYISYKSQFYIFNRYYSDSILKARGGEAEPLVVTQYVKGRVEEIYRQ